MAGAFRQKESAGQKALIRIQLGPHPSDATQRQQRRGERGATREEENEYERKQRKVHSKGPNTNLHVAAAWSCLACGVLGNCINSPVRRPKTPKILAAGSPMPRPLVSPQERREREQPDSSSDKQESKARGENQGGVATAISEVEPAKGGE